MMMLCPIESELRFLGVDAQVEDAILSLWSTCIEFVW